MLSVFLFATLGLTGKKIITQQNQIQEDLKELKSLLEQEGYKDKEIKDKHFLDVEI